MNETELVAKWTRDSSSLRELVERALTDAVNGTDFAWYMAHEERPRSNRYVLYARSQPWAEGLLEHYWSERSPWPEGQFYTLDVSLDCEHLVLTHSNDTRNEQHNLRNVALHTATTVSLHTLATLVANERQRDLFERYCGFSSLEGIIRWMLETCAPNHFSVT